MATSIDKLFSAEHPQYKTSISISYYISCIVMLGVIIVCAVYIPSRPLEWSTAAFLVAVFLFVGRARRVSVYQDRVEFTSDHVFLTEQKDYTFYFSELESVDYSREEEVSETFVILVVLAVTTILTAGRGTRVGHRRSNRMVVQLKDNSTKTIQVDSSLSDIQNAGSRINELIKKEEHLHAHKNHKA